MFQSIFYECEMLMVADFFMASSRECWCAQTLSGIAERLDDAACNYPCEGDNTTACGGSLKLSVYRASFASQMSGSSMLCLAIAGLVTMVLW